jgi:flagellar protein FlbD
MSPIKIVTARPKCVNTIGTKVVWSNEKSMIHISQACSYVLKEEAKMIEVTRLNGTKVTINAELIEKVEEAPDTVISLTSGNKLIVKESRQEIRNLVILYKKEIFGRDM